MAGSITVSSITLDSDNTFSIKSNTGANLFALNSVNQSVTGNLSLDSTGTTGVRSPSANTLVFYEGGVEAMRIDSSGNVGIGTGASSTKLGVAGVISFVANESMPAVDSAIYRPADGSLALGTNGSERMRIDSSGNVGIGTSSPTDNLYISRATNAAGGISVVNTNNAQASQIAQLYLQGGDNAYAQIKLQANSVNSSIRGNNDGSLAFLSSTTERMRITSSGLITTNIEGSGTLYAAYSARAWVNFDGTTNTGGFCTIRGSGGVTSVADNGTGNYTVNFSFTMPDTNYAVCIGGRRGSTSNYMVAGTGTTDPTTSAYNFETQGTTFSAAADYDYILLSFFR